MLSVPPASSCRRMSQVYNQIDLIPAGTARRDALRLTKKKAKSLPRVTAYATARCAPPPPFCPCPLPDASRTVHTASRSL